MGLNDSIQYYCYTGCAQRYLITWCFSLSPVFHVQSGSWSFIEQFRYIQGNLDVSFCIIIDCLQAACNLPLPVLQPSLIFKKKTVGKVGGCCYFFRDLLLSSLYMPTNLDCLAISSYNHSIIDIFDFTKSKQCLLYPVI